MSASMALGKAVVLACVGEDAEHFPEQIAVGQHRSIHPRHRPAHRLQCWSGAEIGAGRRLGCGGSVGRDLSHRKAPMEAARFCQSARSGGSAGTGPSASTAQDGAYSAACSPMRYLRASISPAISARYARRSRSAMAGTWADHGPAGAGTTPPIRYRSRAVDDGNQVAGPGQVPLTERSRQDPAEVQVG